MSANYETSGTMAPDTISGENGYEGVVTDLATTGGSTTEKVGMTAQNLDTALQNAFTTVNIFILILIMIAMGAKMKLKHIREHVQKPMGPLAGFISQFVIMPLVAFVVAHILRMDAAHAIGALIMACSPGGVMSNMVTFYTNGDCSLSITMTTLSTIMAFGMMPANLWLYTRSWTADTELDIPYASILLSLLLILIPVTAGYMFIMKYPNMRGVVAQTGSFSGVLAIVISMLLFMFMHWSLMLEASKHIWIATATMPILGFVLGYMLSALFCLSAKQKRTVGFETGCQNASIAFSVISTSFKLDAVGHVLLVPLLFCLFSFIEGWLFVIFWQLATWVKRKVDDWKEDGWACVDWEESSDESDKEEEKESGHWVKPHYFSAISHALSSRMKRKETDGNDQQASVPNTPNMQLHVAARHGSRNPQLPNGSVCFSGYEMTNNLRMTALSMSQNSGDRGVERVGTSGSLRHNTHSGVRSSHAVNESQYQQFPHYAQFPSGRESSSLTRGQSMTAGTSEHRRDRLAVMSGGQCQLSSSAGANNLSTGSAFMEAATMVASDSVSRHHSCLGLDPRNIITDV